MSDDLSLAGIGASALAEGVKFLFTQAGEALKHRRERKAAKTGTPAVVAEPRELPPADLAKVEEFEPELKSLRADLLEYVSGSDPIEPTDLDLVRTAEALRRVLEAVHGTSVVFAGEVTDVVVRGALDADEVAGYVAAVRADRVTGTIEGTTRVRRVEAGGQAVGVDLTGQA
jgi:hypothetical protein